MNFNKKIFFYCYPQGTPDKAGYQHSIVALGEGLKESGIEFYSDKNYWRLKPDKEEYLFNYNKDVTPDLCDIVIINDDWFSYNLPMPENLLKKNRKYLTIFFDHSDGLYTKSLTKEFREFDIIFRTHYNKKIKYPANIREWAFGLSNRIIEELKEYNEFENRIDKVMVNFRVLTHNVRNKANKLILPLIEKIYKIDDTIDNFSDIPDDPYIKMLWEQSGRRHYPSYYKRLKESKFCSCFGGVFITSIPKNILNPITKFLNRILDNNKFLKTNTITQFDSWRFWESLYAGCVTLHIDFDKYGCLLPEHIVNWKHYIGFDLNNIKHTVERLQDDKKILKSISIEGRKWAIKNYSPKATAERFLNIIKNYL